MTGSLKEADGAGPRILELLAWEHGIWGAPLASRYERLVQSEIDCNFRGTECRR